MLPRQDGFGTTAVASMQRARRISHKRNAWSMCVMGGSDGYSHLRSAEMYDTSAGQWRALPEMSVARRGCAAVCIEGNVYVMGGYDGGTEHASVECYNPIASKWRALPTTNTVRLYCAAVACGM